MHMGWFSEAVFLCPMEMETWFGDHFEEIRPQKQSRNMDIFTMHTEAINWAMVQ